MDIDEIESDCEATTGISPNKLKTCPDMAKFIQCVFAKAKKMATQEKPPTLDDDTGDSGIKTNKMMKPNGRVVVTKKP